MFTSIGKIHCVPHSSLSLIYFRHYLHVHTLDTVADYVSGHLLMVCVSYSVLHVLMLKCRLTVGIFVTRSDSSA